MSYKIGPIQYAFKYLKHFPMASVTFVLIVFCFILETAGLPYLSKQMVALVSSEESSLILKKLPNFLIMCLIINFLIGLIYRLEGFFIEIRMITGMRRLIQVDILNVLMGKNYSYHLQNMPGDLVTKITDIMDSLPEMIKVASTNVFKVFIGIMLSSCIMWSVHPFFTFMILFNMGLFIGTYLIFGKTIESYAYKFFTEYAKASGRIADFLNNFINFALFSNKKQQNELFTLDANKMYNADIKFRWNIFVSFTALWAIYLITTIVNLVAIMNFIRNGKIKPSDSILIIGINFNTIGWLFYAVYNLGRILQYYGQTAQAIDAIYNLDFRMDLPGSKPVKVTEGSIEFKDVCFGYSEEVEVLHNLSFKIEPCSKIGIVGPSGSGKSTILKLITRLCRPVQGSILVGNQDTKMSTQESLSQFITSLPQDTLVFSRSVRDNICYDEASEAKLIELMKKLGLHDAIISLPSGYDTIIGSGGSNLSGGQIQRLGAARALMREQAKIILLDEPTAHLDPTTTEVVYNTVLEQVKQRKMTMVMVAHDMNMVMEMDRILVVVNGKVVQDGAHQTLIKDQKGTYFKLFGN